MLDIAASHIVRIHINRVAINSPNPTTGEALYALADIKQHERLYREVAGDEEDERIPRDDTPIHLTQDQHFYSQKVFDILVNGDDHEIDTKQITYARVVDLYSLTPAWSISISGRAESPRTNISSNTPTVRSRTRAARSHRVRR